MFVVLTFVLITAISSGGMKGLNGQDIISSKGQGVSTIAPAAGDAAGEACGDYMDWIGKKISEKTVKNTGQPYRILPPNAMATMDHNPERINVHVNDKGIVENVECG